jgi:hypothetical protein
MFRMAAGVSWLLCAGVLVSPGAAWAEDSATTEDRRAQLEALRGEVASQIQLQGFDLLDELVFQWTEAPPFDADTLIVLADVVTPIGFGSGLGALLENHLVGLLGKNPRSRVRLAHCPQCTAVLVHSSSKATLVTRGVDQPEVLAQAGALSGSKHALFLDFEIEGSELVLRARMTSLERGLPIVWAKTLTTSTSSPALLRSAEHLKSATEARQEYLDALTGRSVFLVPIHLGVRTYSSVPGTPVKMLPMVWLEAGLEVAMTQARAWTGTVSAGVSWAPQLHVGWLAQARVARLLSGSVTSLTAPDLYGFVGGGVIGVYGPAAAVFKDTIPNIQDITDLIRGITEPTYIFGFFQLGLELRVKNRIGITAFLESAPAMDNAPAVGKFIDLGFVKFHTIGVEVSFCF